MIILHVAEKPSVAKACAEILANGSRVESKVGASVYNRVFCFTADLGANCGGRAGSHRMTSVTGHVKSLDFVVPYNKWGSCSPIALFSAPVALSVAEDKASLVTQLEREARGANLAVLWLDCDREGEAIAFEVRDILLAANAQLRIVRARFTSLLPAEIQRAARSPGALDAAAADAVAARNEIDLRIGCAFTRMQTMALQGRFDTLIGRTISYGPCQFPTLGFIVERARAAQEFQKEKFWAIHVAFGDSGRSGAQRPASDERRGTENDVEPDDEGEDEAVETMGADANVHQQYAALGANAEQQRAASRFAHGLRSRFDDAGRGRRDSSTLEFTWARRRLFDQPVAASLFACVRAANASGAGVVLGVRGHPASRKRPMPMTTQSLQTTASRFLRLPSDQTLELAEELYLAGLISYPRTETDSFSREKHLLDIIAEHRGHSEWGAYATKLVDDGNFVWPQSGTASDEAHEPIHPVKAAERTAVGSDAAWRVYSLIVRHFLAACSADATGMQSHADVSIGGEEFSASGLVIESRGWLEVYPWTRWGGAALPGGFVAGKPFIATSVKLHEGTTLPPPLLSEAELIDAMATHAIGTDATMSTHIKTIIDRLYVIRGNDLRFAPTPLGSALVKAYETLDAPLAKPWVRANMEGACKEIAAGRRTSTEVIRTCLGELKPLYERVVSRIGVLQRVVGELIASAPVGTSAPPAPPAAGVRKPSRCGQCRGAMELRVVGGGGAGGAGSSQQLLLFCVPCARGWLLPRWAVRVEAHMATCPLCDFQVVNVSDSSAPPRATALCPKCFNEPPAAHNAGADAAHASFTQMTCNKCTAPGCALATGGVRGDATAEMRESSSVMPCGMRGGACAGNMLLRKGKAGQWRLSCDAGGANAGAGATVGTCEHVIWMPKSVVAAALSDPCAQCAAGGLPVLQLLFSFARDGTVPLDMVSTKIGAAVGGVSYTYKGCVACDARLSEMDFSHGAGVRPPSASDMLSSNRAKRSRGGVAERAADALGGAGPAVIRVGEEVLSQGALEAFFSDDIEDAASRQRAAPGPQFLVEPPRRSDGSKSARAGGGGGAGAGAGGSGGGGRDDDAIPRCPKCGNKQFIATSSTTANPGRKFFRCTSSKDCGFGGWVDDEGGGGRRGAGGRRWDDDEPTARRTAAPTTTGTKVRLCGRCKKSGHTSSNCPLIAGAWGDDY